MPRFATAEQQPIELTTQSNTPQPRFGVGTPIDISPPPITFDDFVSDVWEGVSGIPLGIGSSTASAIEGADSEEIFKIKDWKDNIISRARERTKQNYQLPGAESTYIDKAGIKITRQDVRNLWQNIGFSGTSLVGSLVAGLASAPIPVPGSSVASAAVAGGALGYRMDTNNVIRDLRDGMDQEALQQIGRPLTDDEFITIAKAPEMQKAAADMGMQWSRSGNVDKLVTEHGLHEAGWEALGNVIMLKAGKHLFQYAQKAGLLKGILTGIGGTAGEVATETETQLGQHNVETKLGLNQDQERSYTSLEDQQKSFEEVAGPTALLTAGMGGGAYVAGRLTGTRPNVAMPEQQTTPEQPPVTIAQPTPEGEYVDRKPRFATTQTSVELNPEAKKQVESEIAYKQYEKQQQSDIEKIYESRAEQISSRQEELRTQGFDEAQSQDIAEQEAIADYNVKESQDIENQPTAMELAFKNAGKLKSAEINPEKVTTLSEKSDVNESKIDNTFQGVTQEKSLQTPYDRGKKDAELGNPNDYTMLEQILGKEKADQYSEGYHSFLREKNPEGEYNPEDVTTVDMSKQRAKPKVEVDFRKDDLLTAIAKEGGISREEAEAQGIDPANFSKIWKAGYPIFKKDGKSFDDMREAISQKYYLGPSAGANDLVQAIFDHLSGNKQYSRFVDAEILANERYGEQQEPLLSKESQPTFYSQVQRTVENVKQDKATPEQWKAMINKGSKKEEVDWIGLNEWIDEQKGTVTKQQVQDFIAANQVNVQEVVKGETESKELSDLYYQRGLYVFRNEEVPPEIDEKIKELESEENNTKFENWQLPGGENYRELLLTLPTETKPFEEWRVLRPDGISDGLWASEEAAQARANKIGGTVEGLVSKKDIETGYSSPHYSELNILAHIRFNDRTDADGKRTLFLEEVQGDWGQSKRKGKDVPNAPFIGKTESWSMLAMKRMIRYASENGYDRIAWTTGEQQEERYWGNELIQPAVQRWKEFSKPESIGKELKNDIGSELASVTPLEVVDAAMLATLENDKIKRAVIKSIPVDVVDILTDNGFSTDNLLSEPNVVGKALPVDSRAPVARGFAGALQLVGTRLRAALLRVLSSNSSGRDEEVLPTVRASDLSGREVMRLLSTSSLVSGKGSLTDSGASRTGTRTEPASVSATGQVKLAHVSGKLSTTELANALNRHAQIVSDRTGEAITNLVVQPPPGIGMKGFYDKILPSEVNKYVKKWGGKVSSTNIDVTDTKWPEKYTYSGPEYTLKQLKDALKISYGTGNIFTSPFTGRTGSLHETRPGYPQYSFTRVAVTEDLKKIIMEIESGKTFKEAASESTRELTINWFGGELTPIYKSNKMADVHALDITPAMRDAAMQGQPLFAKTKGAKRTVSEVNNILLKSKYGKGFQKAIDSGLLNIVQKDSLPEGQRSGASGTYYRDKDKIYLIADNIKEAVPVALHEVFHARGKEVVGEANWNTLMNRMAKMDEAATKGGGESLRGYFAQAQKAIPKETSKASRPEELAAYTIQKYIEDRQSLPKTVVRWVQDLLSHIKVWLMKHGWEPKNFTESDLAAIAKAALDKSDRKIESTSKEPVLSKESKINTDTEAFKKWFGDSKVVDEKGEPLVVYHGTGADFSEFDPKHMYSGEGASQSGSGFYFTTNKESASRYSELATTKGEAGRVMPAYLSLKNPLYVDFKTGELSGADITLTRGQVKKIILSAPDIKSTEDSPLMNFGDIEYEGFNKILNEAIDAYAGSNNLAALRNDFFDDDHLGWLRSLSKVTGYDSAYSKTDNGDIHYVAWEPTQIKSIFNRGTFDPNDPNILHSKESNDFTEENRRLREEDKTVWYQAKKFWHRNFLPGGLLPKDVFAEKISRDNELNVVEFDVSHLLGTLENIVKKEYGKEVHNLPSDISQKINSSLSGVVDESLPVSVRRGVYAMRQYIDRLSAEYSKILQEQIKSLSKESPQKAELLNTILNNMGQYVHRSYRAFDDAKWFQKIPDKVINDARTYLIERYKEEGSTTDEATRFAEVALNEIVKNGTAYDSMSSFIQEGKLGAKDLTVLKKRKQIAPQIRELLGEYKDPMVNFAKSASKMSRLIWNQRFLDRVREIGMGSFLFEGKNRPPSATVQIAADGSEVYAPLNGLWTYPEIEQAFKDSIGKEKMADWYRIIVQMNGFVKYGKTILSPTTAARNWQSAMFFSLANGHFDLTEVTKSVSGLKEYFTHRGSEKKLDYLRKLKRLGVVYDVAYAGEMMRYMEDSKIEEMLRDKKATPYKAWRYMNKIATKFYQYGDDFWKIIGFENEKRSLIKTGMNESDAEIEAAERIRNTYPTYSMVGRGIKWLARFPLAGTFVSFPAEIVRTTGNMFKYMAQDFKTEGRRGLAMKRAAGLTFVSAFAYALQAITKSMVGMDDDEEEAVRLLAAPWQSNANLIFTGRDGDGKLQYIDLSFLDPYGYWKKPVNAILRDREWEDKATDAIKEMITPFLGTDIAAGAIFEILANKKETGSKVYNPDASPVDITKNIANHLRKTLQPGIASNLERTYKAIQGEYSPSGRKYDPSDEALAWVGWRVATLEPKTSLYYRTFEFSDAKISAMSTLTRVLKSANKVSNSEISDAFDAAQKQSDNAYRELSLIIGAAMANGMSKQDVAKVLHSSGISRRDIQMLLRGKLPTLVITPESAKRAVQKAGAVYDNDMRKEILMRYKEANKIAQQHDR